MSSKEFSIGSDLTLAIANNEQCKQMNVYVKDNVYFASYHNPADLDAMSIDISEWKVIPLVVSAHWLINGLDFTPEKMIAQIVASFNVADHNTAANANLQRIYGEHPDLPKEKQMDIPARADFGNFAEQMRSMYVSFARAPEVDVVLPLRRRDIDFKAIIDKSNALYDGMVYSYAKGSRQFLSFFSDLGDVSENGIPVATWIPDWERHAWNVNDASFPNNLSYKYPRLGLEITSMLGLLSHLTLSGTTSPTPLVTPEVKAIVEGVAEKLIGAINSFGMGGMRITAENAAPPADPKEVEDFRKSWLGALDNLCIQGGLRRDTLFCQTAKPERHQAVRQFGEAELPFRPGRFLLDPANAAYALPVSTAKPSPKEMLEKLSAMTRDRAKAHADQGWMQALLDAVSNLKSTINQKETQMQTEDYRKHATALAEIFITNFGDILDTKTQDLVKAMLVGNAMKRFAEENPVSEPAAPTMPDKLEVCLSALAVAGTSNGNRFAIGRDKDSSTVILKTEDDSLVPVTAIEWASSDPVIADIKQFLTSAGVNVTNVGSLEHRVCLNASFDSICDTMCKYFDAEKHTALKSTLKKLYGEASAHLGEVKAHSTPVTTAAATEDPTIVQFPSTPAIPFAIRKGADGKAVLQVITSTGVVDVTTKMWDHDYRGLASIRDYLGVNNLGLTNRPGTDLITFKSDYYTVLATLTGSVKEEPKAETPEVQEEIKVEYTFRESEKGHAVVQLVNRAENGKITVKDVSATGLLSASLKGEDNELFALARHLRATYGFALIADGDVVIVGKDGESGSPHTPYAFCEVIGKALDPSPAVAPKSSVEVGITIYFTTHSGVVFGIGHSVSEVADAVVLRVSRGQTADAVPYTPETWNEHDGDAVRHYLGGFELIPAVDYDTRCIRVLGGYKVATDALMGKKHEDKPVADEGKPVPDETPDTLPRSSAFINLLDPLGDNAGIIDLDVLVKQIELNPELAAKEYFLYTVKDAHFVSDRETVGMIYDENGDYFGNMLGDSACVSMLGSELQRQHSIGTTSHVNSAWALSTYLL